MARPISVGTSQYWEGNDGPWSTFTIRVGTPQQLVRVLPSTTAPETWVVLDQGCLSSDPTSCPTDRGDIFKPNKSSTWEEKDIYHLGQELNLGYDVNNNGDYGFDTLGLGYQGAGGPTVENQTIAGIATKEFYLGILGLVPRPVNFSTESSTPSFLSNLKTQNLIPSLSYGYSAGAQYRLKKVEGTLTLGGYDESRFTPNDVQFGFASDVSRDLVVGLRSIKFSDSNTSGEELLSTPILTFIDSTVPHIYLPVSACLAFEKAFGLQYDNDTGLYLVNDTLHEKLVAQNASFIFTLGDQVSGGQTQDIILPYASFDLEASYENLSKSSKYFPLRRAVNDSQYTLGRTFLQETYLIVDYERANFSVAQALFIENAEQKLIPILSLNDTSQNITITKNNPSSNPSTGSHKISPGAIAGLAVAILIALILIFGAVYFLIRRRQREREKRAADEAYDPTAKPELDGEAKPPIGELYNPVSEADSREASKIGLEMEGSKPASTTLDARERRLAEIEGTHGGAEMEGSRGGAEMENGGHPAAVELDAGPVFPSELPNPDAGTSTLSSPMGPSRLPSPGLRDKPMLSPDSRTAQPPDPSTRGSQPLPSPQGREELSLSPAASSVPGTREPRPPPSDGDAKPVSWGQRWSFKRRRRDGT